MYNEVTEKLTQEFDSMYSEVVPEDARQEADAYKFSGPPGIAPRKANDEESSGAQSFLSMSAVSFASVDTSNIVDEYDNHIPAAGTKSWSHVVQGKPNAHIPREVTTKTSVPTKPAASTAFSVMTPSDTQSPNCELQRMRDEYEEKLSHNATEIAELKLLMRQVLSTLNSIGIQQDIPQQPVTNPPAPEPMEIIGAQKRSGNESPLVESGRQKRVDHKSSPSKKLDFRMDE
jgi:hypothetical protein